MAAKSDSDSDLVIEDDYYAWLGLNRHATPEEIEKAYRNRSRVVHPDKHATDPEKRTQAEAQFNKIKKAHDVLKDPHKKAIYDTIGIKGLETEGWEVIKRTKTPQEIIEEYERLQKERDERRLNERTNPRGMISVTVNATDLFDRYEALDSIEYRDSLPSIEISSMSISQSVECPLTTKDSAVLSGNLQSSNGSGDGQISLSCRRLISHKGWAEMEIGAGNGSRLTVRGFRTLWKRGYGTMSGTLQITPSGAIKPGLDTTLATQLDKNVQGRLQWSWGLQSSMTTILLYDNQNHHVTCALQLGVPNTFWMLSYTKKFLDQDAKVKAMLRIGTFGTVFEYGCDKKITQHSRLGASVSIGVPSGVMLRIRLNRGNQQYLFPIHLSEGIVPEAIFYGTVVPLLIYGAVKVLIVNPFMKSKSEKELNEMKKANMQKIQEKRREAHEAMTLCKQTIERKYTHERNRGGLIIDKALYGKFDPRNLSESEDFIDVRDQLQFLVDDSSCVVIRADTVWSEMMGFYDPCIGEKKRLSIEYHFKHKPHKIFYDEGDEGNPLVKIPNREHLV